MNNEVLEKKQIRSVVPAVNIRETPESYIVALDMPGVLKENISARIENGTLIISAGVAENSESAEQYYREFSLADNIDIHTVDAHYDLGVLNVMLNKKQQYLPKQITIN